MIFIGVALALATYLTGIVEVMHYPLERLGQPVTVRVTEFDDMGLSDYAGYVYYADPYTVWLDDDLTWQQMGEALCHELGHVVDFALLTDDQRSWFHNEEALADSFALTYCGFGQGYDYPITDPATTEAVLQTRILMPAS